MPLEDFQECMLYDAIEPFGDPRGDMQMAILASTIANFSGKKLKENAELTPMDFLPNFHGEARPVARQTPEQMHANFLAVLMAAEAKKKQQN